MQRALFFSPQAGRTIDAPALLETRFAIGDVVREHGASFAVWDAVLNKAGFLEGPRNRNGAELSTAPAYTQS